MDEDHDLLVEFDVLFAHAVGDVVEDVGFVLSLVELAEALHVVLLLDSDEVLDERHGTVGVAEIVDIMRGGADELGDVFEVGQRGGQGYYSDALLESLYAAQGSGHKTLENGSSLVVQKMDFVQNQ